MSEHVVITPVARDQAAAMLVDTLREGGLINGEIIGISIAVIHAAAREQCEADGGDLGLTIDDCARALQLFARQRREAA